MINADILQKFKDARVLITGGTGLIGRQVVDILHSAGAVISVVSLDSLSHYPGVQYIFGDLTNFDFCMAMMKEMDYVFHLAGIKASADISQKQLASHFVPSLMMNTNVLEACRRNNVKKVVFTSSIGAYSDSDIFRETEPPGTFSSPPMDFAGWSKRMGELQIHAYHVQFGLDNYSIVRPSNVYGPGDNFDPKNAMVIPSLMYRIYHQEDPVLIWGDGTAIRDFVFSRDVAEGMILAMIHGTRGGYVNLGSGRETSIRELVETLHSFIPFNYRFDPSKSSGFPKRVMDISMARQTIHYHPATPLLEGLKETWNWYVKNQDEFIQKKNYFTEGI